MELLVAVSHSDTSRKFSIEFHQHSGRFLKKVYSSCLNILSRVVQVYRVHLQIEPMAWPIPWPLIERLQKKNITPKMSAFVPINPKPFLNQQIGKPILLKLKWNLEYKGILTSVDSYMNLLLNECEEFVDGTSQGMLGETLVRCNNILYVKSLTVDEDDGMDQD